MTDVGEAISTVLALCDEKDKLIESIPAAEASGRRLAESIVAAEPFPPFAASVLDGYAVNVATEQAQQLVISSTNPATYYVVDEQITAGVDPTSQLGPGQCAYVTTGAKLPMGSNAVIGIEKVTRVKGENHVMQTSVQVAVGANVRQVGKDIPLGTLVLKQGAVLKSAELGILATLGQTTVRVSKRTIVGVFSTGNELIKDPVASPSGGCIRDANRVALIQLLQSFGAEVLDLGLLSDDKEAIRVSILDATVLCDVVVTSGGVSMGSADHIKPLLEELGTVHFGRLNMKPGKPTTFASIETPQGKDCFVFGLPGNPVSCLVTARLLIEPALKLLAGVPKSQCMHPQVDVQITKSIQLDPERPEYHRAMIEWVSESGCFMAHSTGAQQSSRLLSLVEANALVCVPEGEGSLPPGTILPALLIDTLPPPTSWERGFHGAPKSFSQSPTKPPMFRSTVPHPKCVCTGCLLLVAGDERKGAPGSALLSHLFRSAGRHGVDFQLMELRTMARPSSAQVRELIDYWCTELRPRVILILGGCSIGDSTDIPTILDQLLTKRSPSLDSMLLRCAASAAPEVIATERSASGLHRSTFVSSIPGLGYHSSFSAAVQAAVDGLLPLLPHLIQVASPPTASATGTK